MLNLRDLVFSLLSSLTRAQEQADRMACDIARTYQSDDLLQYLPIPNASFDEVDMNLRFSVVGKDDDGKPLAARHGQRKRILSQSFVRRVAHGVSREILKHVGQSDTKVISGLARHLDDAVDGFLEKVREDPDGDIDVILNNAIAEIESRVSKALSGDDASLKTTANAIKEENSNIRSSLKLAAADASTLDQVDDIVPSLTVDIGANPNDENMQSMNIKLKMRNYRWIRIDDSGQQKLVPEDQG